MPKNIFNTIKNLKLSRSRQFDNQIRIRSSNNFEEISYNKWPETWKKIFYKAYPRFDQVILPPPSGRKFDLYQALVERESSRKFSKEPIEFSIFGDLLYYSVGMKNFTKKDSSTKRFYPSAGARYPLEIYPFVFNVEKIESAAYHYHFKTHSLELILRKPFFRQTLQQFSQSWIQKSGTLFVITAIFDRTEVKYKDRGYRHILTEYGNIAQNLYLVGTALKLGCCPIGGFVEDGLNNILDIDGIDESVIGVIAIGNKQKR